MNKIYVGIAVPVIIATVAFALVSGLPLKKTVVMDRGVHDKVYVALEGEGKVSVIDAMDNQVIRTIDLSEIRDGSTVEYMAHNVQVAPDGSLVAVTANVNDAHMRAQMEDGSHGMDMTVGVPDQVILIDPRTDSIVKRIPVAPEAHLAHVVFEPHGKTAWATLQQKDVLNEIDLETGKILGSISLAAASAPHGLRITPDGSKAFIALMGRGIAVLNTVTGVMEIKPTPGAAVQTAITPDGAYVFASIYDTKQVAWLSLKDSSQGLIDLSEDARGPVQLYPSPDSRYIFVADQGYYFDQPNGNAVYRIDVASKKVDSTIAGGVAPHGVVVSKDGTRVYVTNLLGDDVSVIDTYTNKEIARIPTGDMPNGVSIWSATMGGTP